MLCSMQHAPSVSIYIYVFVLESMTRANTLLTSSLFDSLNRLYLQKRSQFEMDNLPPNFINDFKNQFNEQGGTNPKIQYENAVACVLSDILRIPCENIRINNRFSFLVSTQNRMALFQQTIRRRRKLLISQLNFTIEFHN